MMRIEIRAVNDADPSYKALTTVFVPKKVWERYLAQSVGESPTARLGMDVEKALGMNV